MLRCQFFLSDTILTAELCVSANRVSMQYQCTGKTGKYILLKEDQRMTVNASMEKMFSFFSQLASVFDYLSYQKNTVVL